MLNNAPQKTNVEELVNAEATARQNADSTLQTNINNEATTRQNADGDLQRQLNNANSAMKNCLTGIGITVGWTYIDIDGLSGNGEKSYTTNLPANSYATGGSVTMRAGNQYSNGAMWGINGITQSGTIVTVKIYRPNNDGNPNIRMIVNYITITQPKSGGF